MVHNYNFHSLGTIPCLAANHGATGKAYAKYCSLHTRLVHVFIHLCQEQQCGQIVLLMDKNSCQMMVGFEVWNPGSHNESQVYTQYTMASPPT